MSSSGSLPASPNRANPNSSRLRNWLNAPQTESNPDLLANDTQQREQDQLEMSLSSLGVSDVQSIKQQHSQDEQFDQTRGANQHQDSNETVTLMSRLSSWAGVQMHQVAPSSRCTFFISFEAPKFACFRCTRHVILIGDQTIANPTFANALNCSSPHA